MTAHHHSVRDRLRVLLFGGLVMACGAAASASYAQASALAAPQPADMTGIAHPPVVQVDLKLDVEPAMFQGTVAAIDPSDSSLTIRTDYGLVLRLFSMHCQDVSSLRAGDRVLIEPDPEGPLTVTTRDRTLSHLTQNPASADDAVWPSGRCEEGTL